MPKQKDEMRQGGWFLMAATVVVIILASTLHAAMTVLIAIGVVGMGAGITALVIAARKSE